MPGISYLGMKCKSLAMFNTPIDSGNMRHNALKYQRTEKGFKIFWSAFDAHYIRFVNYGTSFQDEQLFVLKTYIDMISLLSTEILDKETVSLKGIRKRITIIDRLTDNERRMSIHEKSMRIGMAEFTEGWRKE